MKPILRYNIRWRMLFAGINDKYKSKSFLVSEISQLVIDYWHPKIKRQELVDLKNHIKGLFSDSDQEFKRLTEKQKNNYFEMNIEKWKEKYPDI